MDRMKALISSVVMLAGLCVAASVEAEGYQQLSPVAAYTSDGGTYIVFAENIGVNGCSLNRNNLVITTSDGAHSPEFVKAALSVALTSIATATPIKVYWSGCLNNGRPKAILVGLGTTEVN